MPPSNVNISTEPEPENKYSTGSQWDDQKYDPKTGEVVEAPDVPTDTELLDWLVFYSGKVTCSSDGEDCWVSWLSADEDVGECTTEIFNDARAAIRAAMKREESDVPTV